MTLNRPIAYFTDSTALPSDTMAKLAINIATFLTVLCWVFIVLFMISRFVPKLKDKFGSVLGENVFFLLWLIPVVAMFMSLYFSEVLGWRPCKLCWYQRGFMYSLALLMLIYWFKRTALIRRIGYVLAGIGPIVSIYHVAVEIKPSLESLSCDPNNSCAAPWFGTLNWIIPGDVGLTTAGMALTAFLTIQVLLYLSSKVDVSK